MTSAQDKKQIASRYATALFALALEDKKLDKTAEEITAVAALIAESAEFKALCYSPVLSRAAKEKAVEAVVKKGKLSLLTARFLAILAENQRLSLLASIADAFTECLRAHRGEMIAEVMTAAPLDAKIEQSLSRALSRYVGCKVTLVTRETPKILGGLTIRLGGMMIDASVAGKLHRLQERLHQGVKQAS